MRAVDQNGAATFAGISRPLAMTTPKAIHSHPMIRVGTLKSRSFERGVQPHNRHGKQQRRHVEENRRLDTGDHDGDGLDRPEQAADHRG